MAASSWLCKLFGLRVDQRRAAIAKKSSSKEVSSSGSCCFASEQSPTFHSPSKSLAFLNIFFLTLTPMQNMFRHFASLGAKQTLFTVSSWTIGQKLAVGGQVNIIHDSPFMSRSCAWVAMYLITSSAVGLAFLLPTFSESQ